LSKDRGEIVEVADHRRREGEVELAARHVARPESVPPVNVASTQLEPAPPPTRVTRGLGGPAVGPPIS
jgi:hypothetical protein